MRSAKMVFALFMVIAICSSCAVQGTRTKVSPTGAAELTIMALDPAKAYDPYMRKTVRSDIPRVVVAELAPTGRLRAAINFGNPILAAKDTKSGEPTGVSVDIARELAERLGVPLDLVTYSAAGKVVEGIKSGDWDIAYFAIDPVRAMDTDFTAAYVVIEGAYLVKSDSPIRRNEEVDRVGNRVVVGKGSAYDLHLTREIKSATLVRAPTSPAVVDMMLSQKLEVAAGVKQQLQADARRIPGLRILDGRFMTINQAMATPKGRPDGVRYLASFVEELKATGFIDAALKRHGIEGASVAPASR